MTEKSKSRHIPGVSQSSLERDPLDNDDDYDDASTDFSGDDLDTDLGLAFVKTEMDDENGQECYMNFHDDTEYVNDLRTELQFTGYKNGKRTQSEFQQSKRFKSSTQNSIAPASKEELAKRLQIETKRLQAIEDEMAHKRKIYEAQLKVANIKRDYYLSKINNKS